MISESVLFGPGFWGPIVATAALLLITAVGWLILIGGRRITKAKPSSGKIQTYACGETLKAEEAHVDSEQFFSTISRVFRPFYRYVRPGHTGVLSTYLFWVVVGLIIILAAIAVVLR